MDQKSDRRQKLIAEVQEVARRLGTTTLSRGKFRREAGIPVRWVDRDYESWSDLCRAAGISSYRTRSVPVADDELFSAMRDAFLAAGRIPSLDVFEGHFRYTKNLFALRGIGWTQAKVACRRWLEANDPGFPFLADLPTEAPPVKRRERAATPSSELVHKALGTRLVGESINFRALAHAPVNENGVILLFGMVARELGYVVEVVHHTFPDCEARRRVARGKWERVRIEFEYLSRTFLQHGHDLRRCDLIVCWENNWPDCPIEVLELKKAIASLPP